MEDGKWRMRVQHRNDAGFSEASPCLRLALAFSQQEGCRRSSTIDIYMESGYSTDNMQIISHTIHSLKIAELKSNELLIRNAQDGLDILGTAYYDGYDAIILYAENIVPEFFDLSSGLAGEILQKFSNYRMRLAIVGDIQKFTSNSLLDFVRESNKSGQVSFIDSLEKALAIMASQ